MTFEECCSECLKNEDLVKQFNRLTGFKLGVKRSGIDAAIDEACGINPNKEAMPKFIDFVYEFVWLPMLAEESV